jgi:thiosulfate/3-mercaptopyruvate sulfurtransferase
MSSEKSLLVSPEELAPNLNNPAWVVVDCRHDLADVGKGRRAYAHSHIPGAFFLHLDEDLSGKKTGENGRHPLPEVHVMAAKLGAIGIDASKRVVAYDDAGGPYAARLWWTLKWLGHDNCAILDGGIDAWTRAGKPTTQEVPAAQAAKFTPRVREDVAVDLKFIEANLQSKAALVIDARAAERYRGENETIDPVAGHIPGAGNRFFKQNLAADGRFKKPEELRAAFLQLMGTRAPGEIVNQCGSGVTAAHNLFAMELAGLAGSKLYPGSWSEWCAAARPVAKGDA